MPASQAKTRRSREPGKSSAFKQLDWLAMNEIRCGNCRKKLAEGEYIRLAIKCPRCGAFNQLSAQSAPQEPQRGPKS